MTNIESVDYVALKSCQNNITKLFLCLPISLQNYPLLGAGSSGRLPPGSFLTGSADNTIRVWNLNPHMPEDTAYKRNIYSNVSVRDVQN